MPRTKISKNPKRNRDAAIREEKIREFDSAVDQAIDALDTKIRQDLHKIDTEILAMKSRISQKVLSMKLGDLMNANVAKFCEVPPTPSFAQLHVTESLSAIQNQSSMLGFVKRSNDEGYLTEDSTTSVLSAGQINLSHMRPMPSSVRVPGPLSSAKARKPRRSRSTCGGYPGSVLKPILSANTSTERTPRQKLRTPMTGRQKALSADRTPHVRRELPNSPTALLRWPKPGEVVISMTGTPVVSQVMPEQYANVNIPIRDGVLSLRPKKLQIVDPDIVQKIDNETLSQIKLLQSNLELIMSYVDKAAKS